VRIDSGFIILDSKNLIDQQSEFFYIGMKIDY